jgi:type IV secretory pathway TraG/TraD family ATPase VirD4
MMLGRTRRGRPVQLSAEERARHIQVVGASGFGKSNLLDSMLREDIKGGRGLCLIDPHGTLADSVIRWCAATGMDRHRRIHVIQPSDAEWSVGFNPLRRQGDIEPNVRVDAMVAACAQVWGGEDSNSTPLLKKCLRAVFYALLVHDLTLADAQFLTAVNNARVRRSLTDELPDLAFSATWRDFHALSPREFLDPFSSTNNRLLEFLSSPVIRRIVGQQRQTLDFRAAMDKSEIVIVNLKHGGGFSRDNARVLGTLITSELFLEALARDPAVAKRRPFTLYIDECYDFLTSDIENMLDQTRKFGLHLVLSHQRLGQIKRRSESIYNAVMTGAQTKVVFGGMSHEDADLMADEIMRTSINLERPKRVLDKPVVVDEVPFWLESESWSESESITRGESDSTSWTGSVGGSGSTSETYDLNGNILGSSGGVGSSWGATEGGGYSSSRSETRGTGHTQGRSQTLKPYGS